MSKITDVFYRFERFVYFRGIFHVSYTEIIFASIVSIIFCINNHSVNTIGCSSRNVSFLLSLVIICILCGYNQIECTSPSACNFFHNNMVIVVTSNRPFIVTKFSFKILKVKERRTHRKQG